LYVDIGFAALDFLPGMACGHHLGMLSDALTSDNTHDYRVEWHVRLAGALP
jgi:hypothetical protein